MTLKKHGRQYDLVLFGASGYTGKRTAEYITRHLPTDLKWAVAGRTQGKLEEVVAFCKSLNPDRRQPSIEICALDDSDLSALAAKTFVLLTTVGPFGKYGEPAFKACALNGTHYVDSTGETPFVARMLQKYDSAARTSGAIMLPQCGLESVFSDMLVWELASAVREHFSGARAKDVTVSVEKIKSKPSGGTLASALSINDNFSLAEVRNWRDPYHLSPMPKPSGSSLSPPSRGILGFLTGVVKVPGLGLQTTSIAAITDTPIVLRTWGLLESAADPVLHRQSYSPNFNVRILMRAGGYLRGMMLHYSLFIASLLLMTPLRWLIGKLVYQPGQGPSLAEAESDEVEYRGVATPDHPEKPNQLVWGSVKFHGPMYYLTGVTMGAAALTLLEEDHDIMEGGIWTTACLGKGMRNRLEQGKVQFEIKTIPV